MFKVGDTVKSKVNEIANRSHLTYTVKKVNKTTVWVETNDNRKTLYKNVRPSILEKVNAPGGYTPGGDPQEGPNYARRSA